MEKRYNLNSWILLVLSALLYPLPFLFPEQLWWIAFVYLIPLLYAGLSNRLTAQQGYLWAMVCLGGHMGGVLHGIFSMASGPMILRLMPSIGILLVQPFYGALCFWIAQQVIDRVQTNDNYKVRAVVWATSAWMYLIILEYFWMIQYDVCEGYMLLNPLVPLIVKPQLLWLLPFLGKPVLMAFLVAVQISSAFLLFTYDMRFVLYLSISMGFWIVSYYCAPYIYSQPPAWTSEIVGMQTFFGHTCHLSDLGEHLVFHCKKIITRHPDTQYIVFPESSIFIEQFQTTPELVAMLCGMELGKPLHVIIGSFRIHDGYHRNSLFWIYDGEIVDVFDKRHAMALTERVPRIMNCKAVEDLYFKYMGQVKPSDNKRPLWHMNDIAVTPYLCSELFFNQKPDDDYPENIILACCNDSWTHFKLQKKLMYLGARFKALEWQRPIIYVTFSYTAFLTPQGTVYDLCAEHNNL